jgi:hypothetical protein
MAAARWSGRMTAATTTAAVIVVGKRRRTGKCATHQERC